MAEDIITFDDFLFNKNNESKIEEESDIKLTQERINYLINDFDLSEKDIFSLKGLVDESINEESINEDFYSLYNDINENFSCDIFIEGVSPDKVFTRLVIESEDWNLVFKGSIENGKCVIPIKKLDILKENLTGDIKLEVIADGSVFVPWENKFLVKKSKSVSTNNESMSKNIGIKVDSIK